MFVDGGMFCQFKMVAGHERIPRTEKKVRGETVGKTETAQTYVRALTVAALVSFYIRKLQVRKSSKNQEKKYGIYFHGLLL